MSDLVFEGLPLGLPADLVFGGDILTVPDETAALAGTLPGLAFSAGVGPFEEAEIVGSLPGLSFGASAGYRSDTARPVVGRTIGRFQQAAPAVAGRQQAHQRADALSLGWQDHQQAADGVQARFEGPYEPAAPLHTDRSSGFRAADPVRGWTTDSPFQQGAVHRESARSGYQDATPAVLQRASLFEDAARDRRAVRVVPYREALTLHKRTLGLFQPAAALGVPYGLAFERAVPPNGGPYVPPVVPPGPTLCYTPSPHLVYSAAWSASSGLLFVCENHPDPVNPDPDPEQPPASVVVPIRSVYIVINDIVLRRVSNNLALPALSLSLSIDADSWTWGFSATLPAAALDDVMPDANAPVELEAIINGNSYRVIAESVARERAFGRAQIRVSGRGRNAVLAAPYAPVLSFANSSQRTAQQLMADVLTINGVPLGWDIDWTPEDWLVPSGAFVQQGTYMEALNSIASAAGAYIQPHPTAQTLRVLLRYPVAPWAWNTATPDLEVPAAVMTRESIEWIDKPEYNRVFLTGTSQGVLAQVTRTGSAGELVAPLITDPLITESAAARQRGIAVLADTGRQATVRLSLPVLPETGVITPGKLVRYVDGSTTRLGLVRAVGVEAAGAGADLRQTVTLETHP